MTSGILRAPRTMERADSKSAFRSGAAELDEWFARYAWQNQRANNAVTYVATLDDRTVGYYAVAAAGISRDAVDFSFGKGRPHDIPCILLARLAVDSRAQGRGLGAALYRDAIQRSISASDALGAAALLIHCRDESAREFYLAHADLLESPVDPLHLVLPLGPLKKALQIEAQR